jgi:hypothetical protein
MARQNSRACPKYNGLSCAVQAAIELPAPAGTQGSGQSVVKSSLAEKKTPKLRARPVRRVEIGNALRKLGPIGTEDQKLLIESKAQ